jgi:tRNA(Ile)-lysidine synthase
MTQSLDAAIESFAPALPLGVALSGGADSTALLVACARKWPVQVVALHVNHGLQAAASDFERQCAALCHSLGVELRVLALDAHHRIGQSPEDAARLARYRALTRLALGESGRQSVRTVALAQHADDQVETMMLALSRGAGLAGLSGMRASWQKDGIWFCRPLLSVSGTEIRQWLRERGISHIEDPTNQDERFTRNRIRYRLLPVIEAAFPQFRETFARSAAHAAQGAELLETLAAIDLAPVLRSTDGAPLIEGLQSLTADRQANALRYWLKTGYAVIPTTTQLDELQKQISACTTRGHSVHIKVGLGFVERRGEVLDWYNPELLLPKFES